MMFSHFWVCPEIEESRYKSVRAGSVVHCFNTNFQRSGEREVRAVCHNYFDSTPYRAMVTLEQRILWAACTGMDFVRMSSVEAFLLNSLLMKLRPRS